MRYFGGSGCNPDIFRTMFIGQRAQQKSTEDAKFGKVTICTV